MKGPHTPQSGREPGKITEAAREDIQNLLVPILGLKTDESERIRDMICDKHGLTRAQVGTVATKAKKKKEALK